MFLTGVKGVGHRPSDPALGEAAPPCEPLVLKILATKYFLPFCPSDRAGGACEPIAGEVLTVAKGPGHWPGGLALGESAPPWEPMDFKIMLKDIFSWFFY
jgi:hypothetical protein